MFIQSKQKWRLRKIKSLNNQESSQPLRTTEIVGQLAFSPTVGKPLHIYAKNGGLEYGPDRLVSTSPITEILEENEKYCKFHTDNSIYELEIFSQKE